jgi:hypothetical protein
VNWFSRDLTRKNALYSEIARINADLNGSKETSAIGFRATKARLELNKSENSSERQIFNQFLSNILSV